ncbi:hypothetical protein LCGC14_0410180 [marine sediment metagenome]|uniref:Uncharacterized protein n=1 Tax=marine sediment metagenome TaxID=412755 RepID=A0A0F9SZU3_9ZZZZ
MGKYPQGDELCYHGRDCECIVKKTLKAEWLEGEIDRLLYEIGPRGERERDRTERLLTLFTLAMRLQDGA